MMPGARRNDPIGTLLSGPVATISPSATLRTAARDLTRDHVGLLVVWDTSGLRGVLSERDVIVAASDHLDLDVERVVDHAVDDVLWVADTTPIDMATETMLRAEVRHLVVTRNGVVLGIVSLRDVAKVLVADAPVAV